MTEDFSINQVHRLVDEALETNDPQSLVDQRVPFGYNDTQLLAALPTLLSNIGIGQADQQMIFDELRSKLFRDIDRGTLQSLHRATLHCTKCPDRKGAHLPQGNLVRPDLCVVLERPHSQWPEVLAGLSKERTCLTYAARCGFSLPTAEEIAVCGTWLDHELAILQPKLIILCGAALSEYWLGPVRLGDVHGQIFWAGPWALMPVYALAYLERKEGAKEEFLHDLQQALAFLYDAR